MFKVRVNCLLSLEIWVKSQKVWKTEKERREGKNLNKRKDISQVKIVCMDIAI